MKDAYKSTETVARFILEAHLYDFVRCGFIPNGSVNLCFFESGFTG